MRGGIARRFAQHAENVALPALPFFLRLLRKFEHLFQAFGHRGAGVAGKVERAAFDEAFRHALVDPRQINALAKILQMFIAAFGLPRFDNRVHRAAADVFDRREAEPDMFARHRKRPHAGVNIGRQNFNAHFAAFVDIFDDAIRVIHVARQQRGHRRNRKMRLQIGRLIRHERVSGGVRFIEAVAREIFHQVENFVGFVVRNIVFARPFQKTRPLLRHLFDLLFAHRPTEQIGLAERESGEQVRNLHDLFLINNNAVRFLQNAFQLRQSVLNRLAPVLAVDEIVHHAAAERAGTIEREDGDNVFERFGLEFPQQFAHAGTFKLKHAERLPA